MKKINEHQIELDLYTARLGQKQTRQLRYLAEILGSKSLKYTLAVVIDSAFINCEKYNESEDDEDESENT